MKDRLVFDEGKTVIEFEKTPNVIIISEGARVRVFHNGREVKGITKMTFTSAWDDAPTHTIEFMNPAIK